MRKTILLLLAVSGCTATPAHAGPTFPDRGRAGVVDAAHVLTPAAAHALNERVVAWDRRTGHQLVVATVADMQGYPISEYGYQLGRAWGLGDKARNDGAILLLAMKERKVRIEVGYGLEPVLTDATTSGILADRVVPRLKAGDVAGALSDGADAIMAVAQTEQVRSAGPADGGWSWWWLLAPIGAGVAGFFGWVAVTMRRGRKRLERMSAEADARRKRVQADLDRPSRPVPHFRLDTPTPRRTHIPTPPPTPAARRPSVAAPTASPAPVYAPPSYDPPSPSRYSRDDGGSSSASSWGSFDSGSSSSGSSDSSSSSSGFDSGGGSFGGGGSDSSW